MPGGDDLLARARRVGFGNLNAPETPGGNPAMAQALMAGGDMGGGGGGGGMIGGVPMDAYIGELISNPYVDPALKEFVLKRAFPEPQERQGMINVAPGGTIYDPNTQQPLFTAPKEPKEKDYPGSVDEYLFAKSEGFKGNFQEWEAYKESLKDSGMTLRFNPETGEMELDTGQGRGPKKALPRMGSKDKAVCNPCRGGAHRTWNQ